MTISATTTRVSFACDGATKTFPVPIQAYLAGDFLVVLTAPNSAGGAQTTLVLNSDYSLASTGSLSPPQWSLTTLAASAYATGYTLQVILNLPELQGTTYVQGQAFPSLALVTNVDRLTQMVLRQQDLNTRSVAVPDGDLSPLMTLPKAVTRAGQVLVFDANGNVALSALTTLPGFTNYFADSSGAPNTLVVTTGASFAYTAGNALLVKVANANTSQTVNLNVNGLGNQLVVNPDGSNPAIGQFPVGRIALLVYNGTQFEDIDGPGFLALQTAGTVASLASGSTWTLVKIGPANIIVQVSDEGGTYQDVGYRGMPINAQPNNYTTVLADRGKSIYHASGTHTYTIAANASVVYPLGSMMNFDNEAAAGNLTIAINSDVLVWASGGGTGSRIIAAGGNATVLKVTATRWKIAGTGLS